MLHEQRPVPIAVFGGNAVERFVVAEELLLAPALGVAPQLFALGRGERGKHGGGSPVTVTSMRPHIEPAATKKAEPRLVQSRAAGTGSALWAGEPALRLLPEVYRTTTRRSSLAATMTTGGEGVAEPLTLAA